MTTIEKKTIIINSAITWDTIKQRFQHLAENFSKSENVEKVIYIEPYCPFAAIYKNSKLKSIYPLFGKKKVLSEKLTVITPPRIFLPFPNRCIFTHVLNQFILAIWFFFLLIKINLKNTVFIHHQYNYYLTIFFNKALHIYDCVDNHSAFSWINKKVTLYLEKRMMIQCDAVVCTAIKLKERAEKYNKNTYYIPNGSDLILKHSSVSTHDSIFKKTISKVKNNRKKNILNVSYIGSISDRFDWPALKILIKRKNIFLHIYGPSLRNKEIPTWVSKTSFINFYGKIKHENIPSYLQQMDAAIIPFLKNDVTEYTNPVKLYDYLSSGIPIISSDITELKNFNETVDTYNSPDKFYDILISAVKSNSSETIKLRIELAKQCTWKKRSKAFLSLITSLRP